jgi:tRNA threonylcarbamoyladenosine biosynthesis protein TsaB
MDQIYAAEYRFANDRWNVLQPPMLTDAEALSARWQVAPPSAVAGDALIAFASRLDTGDALRFPEARIGPAALAELAERAWQAGAGVDAAEALPLYVRDKVAETTLEREARR